MNDDTVTITFTSTEYITIRFKTSTWELLKNSDWQDELDVYLSDMDSGDVEFEVEEDPNKFAYTFDDADYMERLDD